MPSAARPAAARGIAFRSRRPEGFLVSSKSDLQARPIRKFTKTARRYRTIEIQARPHAITAAEPLPPTSRQRPAKFTADQLRASFSQVSPLRVRCAAASRGMLLRDRIRLSA